MPTDRSEPCRRSPCSPLVPLIVRCGKRTCRGTHSPREAAAAAASDGRAACMPPTRSPGQGETGGFQHPARIRGGYHGPRREPMPMWQEFDQDRESKRVTASKLTGESQAERLCWYCQPPSRWNLGPTSRKVEHLRSSLGMISVMSDPHGGHRRLAAVRPARLQPPAPPLEEAGFR